MASFQDETLDDALGQLRRAAWRVSFSKRLGFVLPALVFVAGAWVLVARFVFDVGRLDSLWGLCLVLLAPLVCWRLANREVPSEETLVAWLDQRAGGTGEVLTQFELGDPRWKRAAAQACLQHRATDALPGGRFQTATWGSLPAGLFVALALWFSLPAPGASLPTGLFDRAIERLAERIEELDALDMAVELGGLTGRLEEIAENLNDGGLEQAFEALDRFQDDLERFAEEHAESLTALHEAAMAAAGGSGGALEEALGKAMSDPKNAELMKTMGKRFEALENLSALSDLDLSKLGGELSEELAGKLAQMAAKGLIDQVALARALARRLDPQSLKDVKFKHAPDCESRIGGL